MNTAQLDFDDRHGRMIDCTPVGLKTPEGKQRANKALKAFEESTAALPNEAITFFDAHEADLLHCMEMYDISKDIIEMRRLIRALRKAQEEFLRAVAGAPAEK